MKHTEFIPKGICARKFIFDIDEANNIVSRFEIIGGCNGNTQALSKLITGKDIDEIVKTLEGIKCMSGGRGLTSCPDQIAQALKQTK